MKNSIKLTKTKFEKSLVKISRIISSSSFVQKQTNDTDSKSTPLTGTTNKETQAVYESVMKQDRHFSTRGKCRKHELQVSVFAFLECSQMPEVRYYSIIHGLGFFICYII